MQTEFKINVATLDAPHRRALEDVIGQSLEASQQVVIHVSEVKAKGSKESAAQILSAFAKVYEGLTEQEIEEIDAVAKTRANLFRDIP